jgi:hypothetical protein
MGDLHGVARAKEGFMKFLIAARTSALLSLLFLVGYGGCNWLSSQRCDVGIL